MKQSKFSGLLHAKLQILKFSFCWFLIGLYTFYNILPVRSRNFNFFKFILLRYFLETLRQKFLIFTSHDPQGYMTLQIIGEYKAKLLWECVVFVHTHLLFCCYEFWKKNGLISRVKTTLKHIHVFFLYLIFLNFEFITRHFFKNMQFLPQTMAAILYFCWLWR